MSSEISDEQIEIIQEFVQESRDMIDQLEPTIIELGNSGGDEKTINAVFRLFHSMKGSAGFLEFNHITRVAHAAENLLDLVRSGAIDLQTSHVSLLCETCDFAKDALEHVENSYEDEAMAKAAEVMGTRLEEAITLAKGGGSDEPADQAPAESGQSTENAEFDLQMVLTAEMVERFVQEADELLQNAEQGLLAWEENPEDRDVLADLFRHVHSFKGNCGFFGYGDMEKLSHQMETVLDAAKSGSDFSEVGAGAVLLDLVDVLRDAIANVAQEGSGRIDGLDEHLERLKKLMSPRLGEMLVERGLVDSETVEAAVNTQKKPLGEILVDMGKVQPEQVAAIVEEQQKKKKPQTSQGDQEKKSAAVKRQDIRVDLEKLDNLINLIGEMVIAENMLIHNPDLQGLELENFNKAAQQMSKLVRELQEMAMVIRMIPVSGLFRRMIRLVHDLSVKSGKKVELKLFGEETEVDKTVIETITDPLVHLLRNSLDHGLEPPEERRTAGKPEKGTVKLSARHEEGEVWITIEDDGRGLNREKILAKAIKNGMI
ncbi:MAG: Hpt domain-containing protein, partial [Desulfuromonadales bacterium]|nr:Hpt domain-containing protein [Desulfuromonadales bacterium]